MVLIKGRPFLEYLIELLVKNGIVEAILLLGYLPEKIVSHFGDGNRFGLKINYLISDIADETGTRVRKASGLLADKFLLMYADNYWPLNLKIMTDFYSKAKVLVTTTIYNNQDGFGEYGRENNVYVKNGLVYCYDRHRQDLRLNGVDIGFFIVDKKVVSKMPAANFSFEKDFLSQLIKRKQLAGFCTDERYLTITNPAMVKAIEKYF